MVSRLQVLSPPILGPSRHLRGRWRVEICYTVVVVNVELWEKRDHASGSGV